MKKILSLLLAITLIFGVLPMSAFADEPNAEPKTDIIDIIGDTVDDPVEDQTDPVEDPTEDPVEDPTKDPTDDPTDNTTNTINATNGGGMILVDSGDGCTCDSFCDDPDCVVCKDDATQCRYYYCICEAVCAEGEANPDCPVCKDDYSKCAQAVTAPQIAPMTAPLTPVNAADLTELNTRIAAFNHPTNNNDYLVTLTGTITVDSTAISTIARPGLTLTIQSTYGSSFIIQRGTNTGNLLNVSNGSTLVLKDVLVDGNNVASVTNSLVLVSDGGTLIMEDNATLSNNIVTGNNFGGGVKVNSGGTFNMTGGTITENRSAVGGGGVFVKGGGTFAMSGTAAITHNALGSSCKGGGVYLEGNATFTMSDNAIISNNSITSGNGGGVCVDPSATFTMENGTISDNSAPGGGGGVSVNGGTFTMNNGIISGNNVYTGYGGGVNTGTFTMNGGTISTNTAGGGGGVAQLNNTFTMSGDASIDDNTAAANGGGVLYNNGTFSMSGTSSITGNTAGNNGGGVWASRSITSFTVKDSAQITCGVYLDGSNLPPSGSPGRTPGGSSAKITLAGTLNPIASIGIEGFNWGTPAAGTIVVTGASAGDDSKFYISNAAGKIGDNNGFVLSGTNIVLSTVAPPAPTPTPSSGGGSSSKVKRAPAPPPWLDPTPAQKLSSDAKQKDSDLVRTKSSDLYGVRKDAWQKLKGYRFVHDTMDGNAVGVRVSINEPEKNNQDLLVSGYTKGTIVNNRKAMFEKWFNNKVQVIHFDQTGAWGQPVEIAAKLDLSGMDADNLYFYSYDAATKKYIRIEAPKYRIDKNGYLHFTTELAGDIIISNGPLEKK